MEPRPCTGLLHIKHPRTILGMDSHQPPPNSSGHPGPHPQPKVDLDLLERKLITLREEMRLLHARLETLNLFTRLGVRPGRRDG
jgi:hypothetical protein